MAALGVMGLRHLVRLEVQAAAEGQDTQGQPEVVQLKEILVVALATAMTEETLLRLPAKMEVLPVAVAVVLTVSVLQILDQDTKRVVMVA